MIISINIQQPQENASLLGILGEQAWCSLRFGYCKDFNHEYQVALSWCDTNTICVLSTLFIKTMGTRMHPSGLEQPFFS